MARGWRCLTVEGLSPSQLLLVPPDVAPCGADELTPLAQRQSQLVFAPLGIPRRDVLIFNPGEGKKEKDRRTHVFLALLQRVKVTRRAKNVLVSHVASGEDGTLSGPLLEPHLSPRRHHPFNNGPPRNGLIRASARSSRSALAGHVTTERPLAARPPQTSLGRRCLSDISLEKCNEMHTPSSQISTI